MGKSNAVTPNALAVTLSKRFGRPITAKMVRSAARSVLGAYDKVKHPAYQKHGYGADDQRRIAATFAARSGRTPSASTAKAGPVRKPRAKVATAAPASES